MIRILEKVCQGLQPSAMMTRDSVQSRAETGLSVCPLQSVWGELSLKQDEIRKTAGVDNIANNMGGVDIDGDNVVTLIDLFLGITFWFLASFSMLLCYFVFDCFDRIRRNRDIKLGKDVQVHDAQDEYERVNNEDSETETDESTVSEEQVTIDIDTEMSAYFTNGKDLA